MYEPYYHLCEIAGLVDTKWFVRPSRLTLPTRPCRVLNARAALENSSKSHGRIVIELVVSEIGLFEEDKEPANMEEKDPDKNAPTGWIHSSEGAILFLLEASTELASLFGCTRSEESSWIGSTFGAPDCWKLLCSVCKESLIT